MKDTLFDITGKIIVITGGFGQIGAEFVKEFHERGARIAIFSRSADEKRKLAVFGQNLLQAKIFQYTLSILPTRHLSIVVLRKLYNSGGLQKFW